MKGSRSIHHTAIYAIPPFAMSLSHWVGWDIQILNFAMQCRLALFSYSIVHSDRRELCRDREDRLMVHQSTWSISHEPFPDCTFDAVFANNPQLNIFHVVRCLNEEGFGAKQ